MKNIVGFDPIIHPPARLQLTAVLSRVDEIEFATAREILQVSDSVLSKHINLLCNAGYVSLRKATVLGRQRTWLSITRQGRSAYSNHIKALQSVLGEKSESETWSDEITLSSHAGLAAPQ